MDLEVNKYRITLKETRYYNHSQENGSDLEHRLSFSSFILPEEIKEN